MEHGWTFVSEECLDERLLSAGHNDLVAVLQRCPNERTILAPLFLSDIAQAIHVHARRGNVGRRSRRHEPLGRVGQAQLAVPWHKLAVRVRLLDAITAFQRITKRFDSTTL